jgi:tetratricopeptide (TPR) repeat protein
MTSWICLGILLTTIAGQAETAPLNPAPSRDAIDRAFHQMYNANFAGAHAIITEEIRKYPEDPLLYALRAAALLFSEYDRMKILELDFFADDDSITDRKRLKPDPAIRTDLFRATGKARELASSRLTMDPQDANTLFALFMAAGVETDYTILVDKKYVRSYSLSKETHKYSRKLLAMNPPVYDAYLSSGMMEYVVGNLNFFFRLFVRFDQIKGKKQKAIEYLNLVIDHGRYYPPYAKILLSVIYLRDKKLDKALALLKELERDFPENPMIRKEVLRISSKVGPNQSGKSGR